MVLDATCICVTDEKVKLKVLCRLQISDWYNVGLELDLEPGVLSTIRSDYPNKQKAQQREMFDTWLKEDTEASYPKLIHALQQLHENACAKHLEELIATESKNSLSVLSH